MNSIQVLDNGYVRHVESWGHGDAGNHTVTDYHATTNDNECGIVEAARQSTQASFRGWAEDERLLRYLFTGKPQHATPFEFAGMTIEVQAPLFVFREWHRHRTQSYNEMSARYAPMPDTHYIPTLERCMMGKDTTNKQAGAVKGADDITLMSAEEWRMMLKAYNEQGEALYQFGLARGLPKEIARLPVSVNRYSRMRASANLRNWLAFLTLRADPAAQWEIQRFANAVGMVIADQFPKTWKLFCDRQTQVV